MMASALVCAEYTTLDREFDLYDSAVTRLKSVSVRQGATTSDQPRQELQTRSPKVASMKMLRARNGGGDTNIRCRRGNVNTVVLTRPFNWLVAQTDVG